MRDATPELNDHFGGHHGARRPDRGAKVPAVEAQSVTKLAGTSGARQIVVLDDGDTPVRARRAGGQRPVASRGSGAERLAKVAVFAALADEQDRLDGRPRRASASCSSSSRRPLSRL
jgi:hypothetical protein